MEFIVKIAVRYYIQHVSNEICDMLQHGEDVGSLQQYLEEAKKALRKEEQEA